MSRGSNQLSHRRYRVARKIFLAAATACGICGQKKCPKCGGQKCGNNYRGHLDHSKARSRGGSVHDPDNWQAAHPCCNLSKGAGQPSTTGNHSHPW